MPYAKDYKNSKLLKDEQMANLLDKIMLLDLSDNMIINFPSEKEASRTEKRIYYLLNQLGRKGDFKIGRNASTLRISTIEPLELEVIIESEGKETDETSSK